MTAAEFFGGHRRGEGERPRGRVLYCSHDAAALGAVALDDVQPLAPLDLRPQSAQDAEPTHGIVWMGRGRTVTHAHYDTSHNLYVQVAGRKHFTLWPPKEHEALRLFPSVHALHRQSSWGAPTHAEAAGSAERFAVTLEPGDALYLPPFYFHHVRAESDLSVSVAVWSDSEEAVRRDELERLPLPWEAGWGRADILLAASQFVRRVLVEAYDGDARRARDALLGLLASRYAPLRGLSPTDQDGLLDRAGVPAAEVAALREVCRVDEDTDDDDADGTADGTADVNADVNADAEGRAAETEPWKRRRAALDAHVREGARRVARAAHAVAPHDFAGVGSLCLANYLEAVGAFVVGRGLLHDFLALCAAGGWARAADAEAGLLA